MQTRNKGAIFVVSAPSGAGKTTLCKKLIGCVDGVRLSTSFTTRAPREGEVADVDYTFITEPEFRRMIEDGDFIEWAEVHGNLYGTSGKKLTELVGAGLDVILDIDVQGARQIRGIFENSVSVFILPPSSAVLRERLERRASDSRAAVERRLKKAREEMQDYTLYDYVIVNDALDEALDGLRSIVTAERHRTRRLNRDRIQEIIVT